MSHPSDQVRRANQLPGIRLGKGPCRFIRFLKFKCGRPHRHPIVIRGDPQQLEPRFGAVEGLSYPSAFFGAGAIPATERKTIVNSHGDICRKYVFLHIAKTRYETSRSIWKVRRSLNAELPWGTGAKDQPWFWTITAREIPPSVHNRGYSATREQAMADFKTRWAASIN